jgi:acetoacetyl-CoA synthetase
LSQELLWQPSESAIANSALTSLTKAAVVKTGLNLDSYADLHKWSISQPGDFWSLVWDHLGIIGDKGAVNYSPGKNFIDAKFFPFDQTNQAFLFCSDNSLRILVCFRLLSFVYTCLL